MATVDQFSDRVRECSRRLQTIGVEALGALFDLTSDRLVRFAIAVTRNQHDAEDAVQAAFIHVASRPRQLAGAEKPWCYLLQMVRNEALLIARKKKRCIVAGELIDLATHRLVDELEQEDTHRAVWSALRTLPQEQAEVVVLKIWEEMTFAEIGAMLNASANTIASRYAYAMNKLSQRLQKQHREARHD
jgi:RNA polymerase sigma-70 factor (ECF subfamily)